MPAIRFDALFRSLATLGTRRRLLGLLTGLSLTNLLTRADDGSGASARGRKGRPDHARHQRQHHRAHDRRARDRRRSDKAPHSEACIPTGQKCPSRKPRGKKGRSLSCSHCCQGLATADANGTRRCGCQPVGESCTSAGSAQCCTGICDGATCQPGSTSPTSPTCAETCAGCCDGSDNCQAGSSVTSCGNGGARCVACAGTRPLCVNQTCAACTSTSQCPANAICDPSGACVACDVCQPAGACAYSSVRAAVDDPAGPSTITICAGLYEESATITIPRNVSLIGAGDGESADSNTILTGGSPVIGSENHDLTLRGLRISGQESGIGFGIGAGDGTLTMANCTITGLGRGLVVQSSTSGGTSAIAFLTDCSISGNTGGGGIFNHHGTTTLTNCLISGNTNLDSNGGGITSNGGTMTLSNCLVTGNSSVGLAGGIYAGVLGLILDNTIVSDNHAIGPLSTSLPAGGIRLSSVGEARLTNGSQVTGNTAFRGVGGIFLELGTLDINASSVTGNTGFRSAGGIYNSGTTNLQTGSSVSGNTGGNCAGPGDFNPDLPNEFCAP